MWILKYSVVHTAVVGTIDFVYFCGYAKVYGIVMKLNYHVKSVCVCVCVCVYSVSSLPKMHEECWGSKSPPEEAYSTKVTIRVLASSTVVGGSRD